jgi:hypothetical protein
LDFKDFFPPIKVRDWEKSITSSDLRVIDPSEVRLYSKLLFWGEKRRSTVARCLSIGAPTSPKISNILMYDFDVFLSAKAHSLGVSYTRYADDITISGERSDQVELLEKEAMQLVRRMKSPKLTFNDKKRGLYTKGQRRMVTGLIITPQKEVSIGRQRKRKISALLHRSSLAQLDVDQRSLLKGLLGSAQLPSPTSLAA